MADWFKEMWLTPGLSWHNFVNGAMLYGSYELGAWMQRRKARRGA